MSLFRRGHFPGGQSAYFRLVCPQCKGELSVGIVPAGDDLRCASCHIPLVPDVEKQSTTPSLDCVACGMNYTAYGTDSCPLCGTPLWSVQ